MLKADLGRCGLGKNNYVDDMALLKEAETRPFYKEMEIGKWQKRGCRILTFQMRSQSTI